MDFEPTGRAHEINTMVEAFFEQELLPRNRQWRAWVAAHDEPPPWLDELKAKAKARGLWNMALPDLPPQAPGTRLSNLEYAGVAEILGRLPWAAEVFNCQAPDVPNMITLRHAGTPEQQARWLQPMLAGTMASGFAMTEPDVASSDATNIALRMTRDGDDYVLNGRKWYASSTGSPHCRFAIVIGNTAPEAPRGQRHTAVIVPMDTPGVRVIRAVRFMGAEMSRYPDADLVFKDVRVPVANRLGAEGDGFRVAQTRLGPARIHHCMRAIGAAEVAVDLMQARAAQRHAFGHVLQEYDSVQHRVAQARVAIDQARLLVQRAAWRLDRQGHLDARKDVSMIKVAVPRMLQQIADDAVQVFGAMGGSDDTPLHVIYANARALRIYDGPDEVHLRQIFRMEDMPPWTITDSPYVMPLPE